MRRATLSLAALLFVVTGIVMAGSVEAKAASESNVPAWAWKKTWKVCEYEDSRNCAWNAKRNGDGGGTSFITTSKRRVIHIEHYEAYRLTHDLIRQIYAP